jgi:LacI family transcriptional regulator
MNNTTLKKISEMLGLSISTVSRALKDHPDISDKTKMRVTELANALDYEPNTNAINLRTSRNNLFGLIVPTLSNFFYDSFIAAIEEECRKHHYSMMILQSGDDPAVEVENLKLCRQNRVGGLFMCISSQTTNLEPFRKLEHMDVPVIFFDKVPEADNLNKVCVADTVSASLAAEAILEKKKKKVLALFGNPQLSITRKRLEAFQHTLGRKTRTLVRHVNNTHEAETVTTEMLAEKPDTVFCMSDEILAGTMKALMKAGLCVPEGISVIAISNGYLPKLYFPEITYVETSGYKLGKLAFSSMMACMGGSQFQQELTIESRLVKGGSI